MTRNDHRIQPPRLTGLGLLVLAGLLPALPHVWRWLADNWPTIRQDTIYVCHVIGLAAPRIGTAVVTFLTIPILIVEAVALVSLSLTRVETAWSTGRGMLCIGILWLLGEYAVPGFFDIPDQIAYLLSWFTLVIGLPPLFFVVWTTVIPDMISMSDRPSLPATWVRLYAVHANIPAPGGKTVLRIVEDENGRLTIVRKDSDVPDPISLDRVLRRYGGLFDRLERLQPGFRIMIEHELNQNHIGTIEERQ